MGTKVQAKDIKNKAFLTTGTAPNYEIAIPRETSYADMDRMEILVNFHGAGTGAITININGLGAKTLGSINNVATDEYMSIVYDLSQDGFTAVSSVDNSSTVGTPWDISSAVYSTKTLDLSGQMTLGHGLVFSDDGTKAFVGEDGTQNIHEFNLSTAWDIGTATAGSSTALTDMGANIIGAYFGNNGTIFYGLDANNDIYEYSAGTAWDITTLTHVHTKTISILISDTAFNDDGSVIYTLDPDNEAIQSYNVDTPWDITTLGNSAGTGTHSVDEDETGRGFYFNPDGTELFISGSRHDKIYKFLINPTWDVSNLTYDSELDISSETTQPSNVAFKPDGTKMYVLGDTTVFEYDLVTTGGGTDTNAIHKNVAGEIDAITEKATPVNADVVIIEDSEDGNNKKKVQVGNLPGGTGAVSSVNGETGAVVLTTGDLTEDTDKNYVTDAEKVVIGNTSGTNTGDQDAEGVSVDTTNFNNNLSSADNTVQKALETIDDMAGSGGLDTTAIHKATAGEIDAITEKATPVNADVVIIEDSEDGNNKKKVQVGNLPGGTGAVSSVNGETGAVVLTTGDLTEDTDKNYVTDAEKVVIGNTSGTNTGDMSDAEVKTAYENNTDTNAFTDAEKTNLGNQSGTNTGDQDLSGLALKTNVLEKTNTTSFTPTGDYNPATKKYVDDSIAVSGTNIVSTELKEDLSILDSVILEYISGDDVYKAKRIGELSAGTQYASVEIESPSICELDTDKYLIGYKDNATDISYAVVATVSGTDITYGTVITVRGSVDNLTVSKLDIDKAVIASSNSDRGYAVVVTVSGTDITLGTEQEFNNDGTKKVSSVQLDTDKAVIAYRDRYVNRISATVVFTVSGTVMTFGSIERFGAAASGKIDIVKVSADKIAVANSTLATSVTYLSISGTTQTILGTVDYIDKVGNVKIERIDNNNTCVVLSNGGYTYLTTIIEDNGNFVLGYIRKIKAILLGMCIGEDKTLNVITGRLGSNEGIAGTYLSRYSLDKNLNYLGSIKLLELSNSFSILSIGGGSYIYTVGISGVSEGNAYIYTDLKEYNMGVSLEDGLAGETKNIIYSGGYIASPLGKYPGFIQTRNGAILQ